jgi:hypothetical protein
MMASAREVKCSVCGKSLKPLGNVLDGFKQAGWTGAGGSPAGFRQWLGTVCGPCRSVYCPDCCNAGGGLKRARVRRDRTESPSEFS